jgi:lipoate-protein ligase A
MPTNTLKSYKFFSGLVKYCSGKYFLFPLVRWDSGSKRILHKLTLWYELIVEDTYSSYEM